MVQLRFTHWYQSLVDFLRERTAGVFNNRCRVQKMLTGPVLPSTECLSILLSVEPCQFIYRWAGWLWQDAPVIDNLLNRRVDHPVILAGDAGRFNGLECLAQLNQFPLMCLLA